MLRPPCAPRDAITDGDATPALCQDKTGATLEAWDSQSATTVPALAACGFWPDEARRGENDVRVGTEAVCLRVLVRVGVAPLPIRSAGRFHLASLGTLLGFLMETPATPTRIGV